MTKPIDISNFDFSVSPAESFYKYVNGSWLIKNKIPAEESIWGTISILRDKSKDDLKVIFDDLLKQEPGSSLVAELYASAMDEETVENSKLEPIADDLKSIDEIATAEEFFTKSAEFGNDSISCTMFFNFVYADAMNSSINTLLMGQGGLGLPDRDYYLEESKAEKAEQYKIFAKKLLIAAGVSEEEAQTDALEVYALEKKLAEISIPREEMRDPVKNYNKRTLVELQELCPSVNWESFFVTSGIQNVDEVVIMNIGYFEKLNELIAATSLDLLKKYLKVRYLASAAPYLNNAFQIAEFEFKSQALSGIKEIQPRWKRASGWVDGLKDLICEIYVGKHFSQEAKAAAAEMVRYIVKAFEKRIEEIDWMSAETKEKALLKLSAFRVKIGYPDKLKDYSSLEGKVVRSNYLWHNVRLVNRFNHDHRKGFYKQPVDRDEWFMPPYMVNAYFNPLGNEIVFPAAILQPPFFYAPTAEKPLGEPALNFGAIGGVIAHEISHGFDDSGSKYDHEGNLVNWWTESDKSNFESRTELIIQQFNEYTTFGQNLNGKLCAGENIADLGGISVAFKAFQAYKEDHLDQIKSSSGRFTPEQEFFISWAQGWRGLIRKDAALLRVTTDPHSPGEHRTNGPLSNFEPFHDAFSIKEGDRMFRTQEKRVSIWSHSKLRKMELAAYYNSQSVDTLAKLEGYLNEQKTLSFQLSDPAAYNYDLDDDVDVLSSISQQDIQKLRIARNKYFQDNGIPLDSIPPASISNSTIGRTTAHVPSEFAAPSIYNHTSNSWNEFHTPNSSPDQNLLYQMEFLKIHKEKQNASAGLKRAELAVMEAKYRAKVIRSQGGVASSTISTLERTRKLKERAAEMVNRSLQQKREVEKAIDFGNFNFSVSPADSFYHYVNGAWLLKNQIPNSHSTWGTFENLHDKQLVDNESNIIKYFGKGKGDAVLLEYYRSALDEESIEKAQLDPTKEDLAVIASIETLEDYFIKAAAFNAQSVNVTMFYTHVLGFPKAKKKVSKNRAAILLQDGLGLPSRDYYLQEEKQEKAKAYKEYIKRLLIVSGESLDEAMHNVELVYQLEYQLAEISLPLEDLCDPAKNNTKKSLEELQSAFPLIDWKGYFAKMEIPDSVHVIIEPVEYFERLLELLQKTDLATLKIYMK
ncbi:hypothetical protein HDV01_007163, partial [Terramyces sp. JEL0728]